MDHLGDLVDDVGSLRCPAEIRSQRGRADKYVAHAHLASAITLAVIACEPLHHGADEFGLSTKEDPFPGDEYVIEDGQDFMASILMVPHIDGRSLQLTGVAGLAAINEKEAFGVRGDGKGDGIVLLILPQRHGG